MRRSQALTVRGAACVGMPLLVALAALAGGCRVDRTRLEASIAGEAAARGWPVRAVECPSGASALPGSRFECTLRFDDAQAVAIAVEVVGVQGDTRWETTGGRVLDMDVVRSDMARKIGAALGHAVTVTCPRLARVGVFASGDRFACEAAGGGARLAIDARVKNDVGDYEFDWKGE